jgi:trk system potassium uptake protein TrkA
MYILIAGAGKVGRYLALNLSENNEISAVDVDEENLEQLKGRPNITTYKADATDPRMLEDAGIFRSSVVAAVTGFDEANLVISQLAKQVYRVPRVVGRVNDPRNQWLFGRQWGVDVAISSPQIILQMINEEATLGEVLTLLKLKVGRLSLVELTIPQDSLARDREIQELGLPENVVVVAVLRDSLIVIPQGATRIAANDSLLMITKPYNENKNRSIFAA